MYFETKIGRESVFPAVSLEEGNEEEFPGLWTCDCNCRADDWADVI